MRRYVWRRLENLNEVVICYINYYICEYLWCYIYIVLLMNIKDIDRIVLILFCIFLV